MFTKNKLHARKYLDFLEEDNMDDVLSLFESDAVVHSPIYGTKKASEFYRELAADTSNSRLIHKGTFEDETGRIAFYFEYKWTLTNGKNVVFDVVDIIEFNGNNEITELRIIYDTVIARQLQSEVSK